MSQADFESWLASKKARADHVTAVVDPVAVDAAGVRAASPRACWPG